MEASINWVNKKKFFLEFDERSDQECLAPQLIKLGGTIVTFLSKKVDFIVTKASNNKSKLLPSKDTTKQVKSRAVTMIIKSQTKAVEGSSDMVGIAKRWNRILEYENLSRAIEQLLKGVKMSADKAKNETITNTCEVRIRILKKPFIKVEDRSGLYKPCFMEFEKFPSINFESKLGGCPFEDPVIFQTRKTLAKIEDKKERFCECCNVYYTDLDKHLASRQHRDFATNDSNYARVDEFIVRNGLDLKAFKEKMFKKHGIF